MDIHKNVRLSYRSREALARFVPEQGNTRKAAAAAFRVLTYREFGTSTSSSQCMPFSRKRSLTTA